MNYEIQPESDEHYWQAVEDDEALLVENKIETNKIYQGDAMQILKTFPDESINCLMTSPPYWALRNYQIKDDVIWDGDENCEHEWEVERTERPNSAGGINSVSGIGKTQPHSSDYHDRATYSQFCSRCRAWKGQLGLEPTFDLYIKHLCDIFDEAKRVLRKDGTCWINLGDTYSGAGAGQKDAGVARKDLAKHFRLNPTKTYLQDKSLCNIPARFSIEMQNRGWILRNTIIWHKPSCMPSSVKDRFTVDFEYIFFFVKNKKYWFETQYESLQEISIKRAEYGWHGKKLLQGNSWNGISDTERMGERFAPEQGRNKRAVWTITTKPFKEAHFAVYPEELCETPIKAGCPEFVCNKCGKAREKIFNHKVPKMGIDLPVSNTTKIEIANNLSKNSCLRIKGGDNYTKWKEDNPDEFLGYTSCNCNAGFSGGIVLDPFSGAGTTALVALKQNKRFVGIELNPEYIKIAYERLKPYLEQSKLTIPIIKTEMEVNN